MCCQNAANSKIVLSKAHRTENEGGLFYNEIGIIMNEYVNVFFTITGWVIGTFSLVYAYIAGRTNTRTMNQLFNKLAAQPL